MFAYKSYLKIGEIADLSSLIDLPGKSLELSKCVYSFSKEIDFRGKPISKALGGTIQLQFTCLPSNPILEWAIKPRKYHDGAIVIYDNEGSPLERIFFTNATCSSLSISYKSSDTTYVTTDLVLSAALLVVGYNRIDNEWKNA